jgi:hypothetical protein
MGVWGYLGMWCLSGPPIPVFGVVGGYSRSTDVFGACSRSGHLRFGGPGNTVWICLVSTGDSDMRIGRPPHANVRCCSQLGDSACCWGLSGHAPWARGGDAVLEEKPAGDVVPNSAGTYGLKGSRGAVDCAEVGVAKSSWGDATFCIGEACAAGGLRGREVVMERR